MPDLLDAYSGDPLLAPAFVGFVSWAITEPQLVAEFEADTGLHLPPEPRTPLDAMIDEACDVTEEYVMAFARWAHDTLWDGEPDDG